MKSALVSSFNGFSNVSPVVSLKNTSQNFVSSKKNIEKFVHYKDVNSPQNESLAFSGIAAGHQRSKTQLAPLLKENYHESGANHLGRFPSTEKARGAKGKHIFYDEGKSGMMTYRGDKFQEIEVEKAGEQGVFDPKVSVDALDKWLNRMTLKKTNLSNESDMIELKKPDKIKDKEKNAPLLCSRVIDSIFNDKEFKEKAKYYSELSPIHERKPDIVRGAIPPEAKVEENKLGEENKSNSKRPMKSMNTKLAELNKKIINDVVFDQMKVRAIKSNSKQVSNSFISSSLQSFKNITKILDQPNVVDFKKIFNKIDIIKEAPRSIFKGLKDEEEKLRKERQPLKREENQYMKEYISILEGIANKKNDLNKLRKSLYTTSARIKSQQELKSQIVQKFIFMEEIGDRQASKDMDKIKSPKVKAKVNNQTDKKTLEDFMRMQKFRQERENQESNLDKMIAQSQEEWKTTLIKTSELENELVSLRLEKNRLKVIIKDLYLSMIKGNEEKSVPALPMIIRALWSIRETYIDNIFPEWIDENSRKYAYEMAKKELVLEKLQKEKLEVSQSLSSSQFQSQSLQQDFLRKKEEVQFRINNIKRIKKKVEIPKGGLEWSKLNEEERALLQEFIKEHNEDENKDEYPYGTHNSSYPHDEESDSENYKENLIKKVGIENELQTRIVKLSYEIDILKSKEAKRLYDIFMDPNKFAKDSKENLFKIFKSLFGLRESEALIERMFKEKKKENLKNKTKLEHTTNSSVSVLESRMSNANSFWDSSTNPEDVTNKISKEESRIKKKFAFLSPKDRTSKSWRAGSVTID